MKTKTTRWSWKAWLARLEESPLDESAKEVGRQVASVARPSRRRPWLSAWQVDRWNHQRDVLAALHRLRRQNLLYYAPGTGHFLPILGPRLPAAGAYRLGRAQLELLRLLLERCAGRGLYHIHRHGYIDRTTDKARWRITYDDAPPPNRFVRKVVLARTVHALARRGLLEANGCTYGGHQWTSEYRVNRHRLDAVANLPADLKKYQRED